MFREDSPFHFGGSFSSLNHAFPLGGLRVIDEEEAEGI